MIIKISNLSEGEHNFVFEDKVDVLDLDKPFYGKYKSSVLLDKLHDQLILSVTSDFKVKYECDRCGTEFKTSLKSDYKMIYLMNEAPEETDSINVSYLSRDADKIDITLEGQHKPHILKINISAKPKKVELDNTILVDSVDYSFDEKQNKLIVRTGDYNTGKYTIFK